MSRSIYELIKTEYERRHKAANDILEERISEVYKAVPRISEIDEEILGTLGKDGFFSAESVAGLPSAFDRLIDFSRSTYVATYCSPARTGRHRLRVEVQWSDMQGIYVHRFDADGFTGGCTAP